MKLFQFTLAFILCSINCNGQQIEVMGEDSNFLKLELFDLEYGKLKENNVFYLKNETDYEFLNYWFIRKNCFK